MLVQIFLAFDLVHFEITKLLARLRFSTYLKLDIRIACMSLRWFPK
jgi:hypothetical protein